MNILVTGGAGYIGSNLIEVLIDDPKIKKIISLDNYFSGKIENHINSNKVEYVNGNTWDIFEIFETNTLFFEKSCPKDGPFSCLGLYYYSFYSKKCYLF